MSCLSVPAEGVERETSFLLVFVYLGAILAILYAITHVGDSVVLGLERRISPLSLFPASEMLSQPPVQNVGLLRNVLGPSPGPHVPARGISVVSASVPVRFGHWAWHLASLTDCLAGWELLAP